MTDNTELAKLDDLILEEKRSIAYEYFCDVWGHAMAEGIDVEIIADELIAGVLVELARSHGDASLSEYVARLVQREQAGDFLPKRILQ